MSAHVVLTGPSTAGKTSLMLGLSHLEGSHEFTVDRTWTTRPRRPNENDEENVFASPLEFDQKRADYLLPFQTFPTYEYGITRQAPLANNELRMRILMPVFAIKFRQLIETPTIICSISPYSADPRATLVARDPLVDPEDIESRLRRYYQDDAEATAVADIRFQNSPGLKAAVRQLGVLLTDYVRKLD